MSKTSKRVQRLIKRQKVLEERVPRGAGLLFRPDPAGFVGDRHANLFLYLSPGVDEEAKLSGVGGELHRCGFQVGAGGGECRVGRLSGGKGIAGGRWTLRITG